MLGNVLGETSLPRMRSEEREEEYRKIRKIKKEIAFSYQRLPRIKAAEEFTQAAMVYYLEVICHTRYQDV